MSKIEKVLKQELDAKVPDLKAQIKSNVFSSTQDATPRRKNVGFSLRRMVYAACIIVMLVAIVITSVLLTPPPGATTVVVSINPRVELTLDGDTIISQKGLNKDGVTLLLNDDYVGMNIDEAVDKLLGRAKSLGFLKDNRTVKLAVNYSNGKTAEKEYKELSALISDFLATNLKGASLDRLTEDELEDIIDSYDEDELAGFHDEQILQFREKLTQVITQKLNNLDALKDTIVQEMQLLGDMDEDNYIPEDIFQKIDNALRTFLSEFPSEINLLSNQATIQDLEELVEEIEEVAEDLLDAIEEIKEGHEDDVKDRIEDLFEIAWELLNPEEDDDD